MLQHGTDNCVQLPRAEVIAQLNDTLRKTGTGGTVMVTQSVVSLPGFDAVVLAAALANYDAFDVDNDPHGERDFGDLTLWSENLLFKVDCYDLAMEFRSDDPADAAVTKRILTVLRADEW